MLHPCFSFLRSFVLLFLLHCKCAYKGTTWSFLLNVFVYLLFSDDAMTNGFAFTFEAFVFFLFVSFLFPVELL